MITASSLFAGSQHKEGPFNCYYCGVLCDGTHSTKDFVKPTFTNRDIVKFPRSTHVCQGCVMSLGDGWEDMPMIDGTVKAFTTARGMCPRMYSWFITQNMRLAFTKGHIATVRDILTNPDSLPEPPFVWVLSDSGQKQLIFRAPVAFDKKVFPIMLEEMVINITPVGLRERVALAGCISSKIGKPILKDPATINGYIAAEKVGIGDEFDTWQNVRLEPLSRLAAWLAPPKEK